MITAICIICNAEVQATRRRVYCSEECRREGKKVLDREYAQRSRPVRVSICLHCKKDFSAEVEGLPGRHAFCSQRCRKYRRGEYLTEWKRKRRTEADVSLSQSRPLPITSRVCSNCTHWGAKGCALEAFRPCNPGVMSRYWKQREEVAA